MICSICESIERKKKKNKIIIIIIIGGCAMVKVDIDATQKKSGKPPQYVRQENTRDRKRNSLKRTQASGTTSIA